MAMKAKRWSADVGSTELVLSDALTILDKLIVDVSGLSKDKFKSIDSSDFGSLYEHMYQISLLEPSYVLSTPCHRLKMGHVVQEIHKNHAKLFDFSTLLKSATVSEKRNKTIMAMLLAVLTDASDWASEQFRAAVFGVIRVLSRSRLGVVATLRSQKFLRCIRESISSATMDTRTSAEVVSHRALLLEAMACLINAMVIDRIEISKICFKLKMYKPLIDIIMRLENSGEAVSDVQYYALHLMFYATVELSTAKLVYDNLAFFRKLFSIFMTRTDEWMLRRTWDRTGESGGDPSKVLSNCRILREVTRVLFNFTLVQQNIVKYKLDKFDDDFTRAVVQRVSQMLALPLEYESALKDICAKSNSGTVPSPAPALESAADASSKKKKKKKKKAATAVVHGSDDPTVCAALPFNEIRDAGLEHLLDTTPGLLSVKMGLVEVCIYDGDILAMNMPREAWKPLAQLMHFKLVTSLSGFDSLKTVCPIMMFCKLLVSYNSKIRLEMKKYIFGSDAVLPEPDSDADSDSEEEDDAAMVRANYDFGDKDVATVRNTVINHLTSVEYSTKRLVGEFLFALCDEDSSEMLRLCGLGSGIGLLVDKGLPGFGQIGKKATTREDVERLKDTQRKKQELKDFKKNPTYKTKRRSPP